MGKCCCHGLNFPVQSGTVNFVHGQYHTYNIVLVDSYGRCAFSNAKLPYSEGSRGSLDREGWWAQFSSVG